MDAIGSTLLGLSVALTPANLAYTFIGVFLGTLVGVLPGVGAAATMALLMPISFGLDHTAALMMMCGVFYGSQYGGSTTAILINTPGEGSSMMTALDGYEMAKKGRAGAALAVAAIGSFVAGTLGIVALTILAGPLSDLALEFGPVEYFAILIFALSAVTSLSGNSIPKAIISLALGLMIATVGIDTQSGMPRFDMGIPTLYNGITFTVVVVGMFAISEVLAGLEQLLREPDRKMIPIKDKLFLTKDDWQKASLPVLRGSVIGFFVGLLPGLGAVVATFLSYTVEKRISKRPQDFGKGAIEGVAGPESANNAAMMGHMVPLLTMGIPSSGTTAVLLGVFLLHGVLPGPLLFDTRPDVVWGLVASMYIGNIMLLLLNLPLVGIFVRLLYTPIGVLLPLVVVFTAIAIYGVNNDQEELFLVLLFGLLGYLFRKCDIPVPPLVLGVVLGDMIEQTFRQSLSLSGGSLKIFVDSPLSITFLVLALLSTLLPVAIRFIASSKAKQVSDQSV